MNIARAAEIDPWPRYGLVAKYKPFILNRIKPFLENNRHLNRNEVITDAIRITWEASQKFKQELGYDFSTYLRHLLPNRLYDLYGIEKSKTDEEEPDILKTEPLQFLGGGNGARLVLDTGVLSVGVRVTGNDLDYLLGTLERLRNNTAVIPRDHENAQRLSAGYRRSYRAPGAGGSGRSRTGWRCPLRSPRPPSRYPSVQGQSVASL